MKVPKWHYTCSKHRSFYFFSNETFHFGFRIYWVREKITPYQKKGLFTLPFCCFKLDHDGFAISDFNCTICEQKRAHQR